MTSQTRNIGSNFLGMLILVAGLGAGIILVTTPQLINKKAQSIEYNTSCNNTLSCQLIPIEGATRCPLRGGISKYCCPSGQRIIEYRCVGDEVPPIPQCGEGRNCHPTLIHGGSACLGGLNSLLNCCPVGYHLERVTNPLSPRAYRCVDDNNRPPNPPDCEPGLSCYSSEVNYGFICTNSLGIVRNCCPRGYVRSNNVCVLK